MEEMLKTMKAALSGGFLTHDHYAAFIWSWTKQLIKTFAVLSKVKMVETHRGQLFTHRDIKPGNLIINSKEKCNFLQIYNYRGFKF